MLSFLTFFFIQNISVLSVFFSIWGDFYLLNLKNSSAAGGVAPGPYRGPTVAPEPPHIFSLFGLLPFRSLIFKKEKLNNEVKLVFDLIEFHFSI